MAACYGNCDTAINAIKPFHKLLFHSEMFSVDLLKQRCAIWADRASIKHENAVTPSK